LKGHDYRAGFFGLSYIDPDVPNTSNCYVNSGKQVFSFGISFSYLTQDGITGTQNIALNNWYLTTATYDGNYMKLYVNGKLEAQKYFGKSLVANSQNLTIAKMDDNNGYPYWANAGIDELRIYNRALTATEVTALYQQGADKKVVLLLHGMNSTPGTWNPLVTQFFPNGCPVINNGAISATATPNTQNTYCYRLRFGALDAASTNKGLGDAWTYGETNGYPSAGDYSTFNQLGTEVNKAITAIKNKLPTAKILLIGHSRGGLAARAFLQESVSSVNKNAVVGLITTGTPHNGSRIGRIYNYIQNTLFVNGTRATDSASKDDWQAIDFLNGRISCNGFAKAFRIDARRPAIGFLADNGSMISNLNSTKANLPAIKYGQIIYAGTYLGRLNADPVYNLFDESGTDVCDQLSRRGESVIKGGTVASPLASSTYPGDGIVTQGSQGLAVFPSSTKTTYTNTGVLHVDEPKRTGNISAMTCRLGFPWLATCQAAAAKAKSSIHVFGEKIARDYQDLQTLTVVQLWTNWQQKAVGLAYANQREQFAVALGIKLRETDGDNSAVYTEMQQLLLNENGHLLKRGRLASLLAEIATSQALDILTRAALNPNAPKLQLAVLNAILTVSESLPESSRLTALSAVLENTWQAKNVTQKQLNVFALSLAKLGSANGVKLLLQAVENAGVTLPNSDKANLSNVEKQALAAFTATDDIINPQAELTLENSFTTHNVSEAVFIAAGNGLANLGTVQAATVLLKRLNQLPDSALPVAQRWLNVIAGKLDKDALTAIFNEVGKPVSPILANQVEMLLQ
jgi:pimeloyl-ACP methyl ester carboxylesterase